MNAAEFSSQVFAAPCCHTNSERKQTHCYTYMQIPVNCFISGKDTMYWHLYLLETET